MIIFPVVAQIQVPANPGREITPNNLELKYNVDLPPNLQESQDLAEITNEVVQLAFNQRVSKNLSITLIDLNNNEIAGYNQNELRYPASIVKLFWMVILYTHIESDLLADEPRLMRDLYQMIRDSDNNAASRIIDKITDTKSGTTLNDYAWQLWLNKRQKLNRFFQNAGYIDINISQKTYPIPYLQLESPQGRELQLRGVSKKSLRNTMTTNHAARLMYEIVKERAISSEYSKKMANLLTRNLNPVAWNSNTGGFNPIKGFFGESLANEDIEFYSKAGWTTNSRQEVAYIATKDGKTRYILAIFGDDPAYGKSRAIFPQMSRLVFDRLTNR